MLYRSGKLLQILQEFFFFNRMERPVGNEFGFHIALQKISLCAFYQGCDLPGVFEVVEFIHGSCSEFIVADSAKKQAYALFYRSKPDILNPARPAIRRRG